MINDNQNIDRNSLTAKLKWFKILCILLATWLFVKGTRAIYSGTITSLESPWGDSSIKNDPILFWIYVILIFIMSCCLFYTAYLLNKAKPKN